MVPVGKNALQRPVPFPPAMMQSIPAGWEVIRPLPFPPGIIEMLPFAAAKAVCTVMVADLIIPPADAMIVEDWLLLTLLVETVKVALVDPAGTVTLAGTVAAAVLLLDNETGRPPDGAAEVRVMVPVAELPPTTAVGLRFSVESDAEDGVLTVQPDNLAEAAVADPSFTFTMQSSGLAKGSLSILKAPVPSLVAMATPLTVIVLLAAAWPSIRSFVPFSSAREMLTVACAVEVTMIRMSIPTAADTIANLSKTCGERSRLSIPCLPYSLEFARVFSCQHKHPRPSRKPPANSCLIRSSYAVRIDRSWEACVGWHRPP